jgi:hypothetical protein
MKSANFPNAKLNTFYELGNSRNSHFQDSFQDGPKFPRFFPRLSIYPYKTGSENALQRLFSFALLLHLGRACLKTPNHQDSYAARSYICQKS